MFKVLCNLFEPMALAIMLAAFWLPSPDRDQWVGLLALIPLAWGLRWISYRRWWTRTPLDVWFLAFIGLAIFNVLRVPDQRGLIMLARPLLGMAIYAYFVELARRQGHMDTLLLFTSLLALLLGVVALTATQWNSKSLPLQVFIDPLPRLDNILPSGANPFKGNFNANELAGALSWMTPLMAGAAIYRWRERLPRTGVTAAFLLLFAALFLGQSRFALIGVLSALFLVSWLLIPRGRWRYLAWSVIAGFTILEVLIVLQVFTPPDRPRSFERDESSLTGRLDIWQSGLHILYDHPLTGVGMSMFRASKVRAQYPVPGYEQRVLPHAHNEWIQIGADLGFPGLIILVAWQITTARMLLTSYRRGDATTRALAVAIGAGLLAHALFGMGDAIPLWDRFAFIFWWLLGLGGAQYILVRAQPPTGQTT